LSYQFELSENEKKFKEANRILLEGAKGIDQRYKLTHDCEQIGFTLSFSFKEVVDIIMDEECCLLKIKFKEKSIYNIDKKIYFFKNYKNLNFFYQVLKKRLTYKVNHTFVHSI
jgi:hypothetical protein